MKSRDGWERGIDGPQVIKGKTYRNLVEFKRPCSICGDAFSIFVTNKIACGVADSNAFGLRNCEEHRRSRTRTDGNELVLLRSANATMKEELDCSYAREQELRVRLAKYELPAAMQAAATKFPWE